MARPGVDLDRDGIPRVRVLTPAGPRERYNPVTVSQYAMANYNTFVRTGKAAHRDAMLRQTDWLLENFSLRGGFGVWRYEFDYSGPGYNCKGPWISCMAQGQGISALIRAHSLTGKEEAARVSRMAAAAFDVPVAEGGVRKTDAHGCVWYREFACSRASNVLNGMIFGLFGLKECGDYFGDDSARKSFDAGAATVKRHLADFEVGLFPLFKWSRYDDGLIVLAARRYHELHVRQLEQLYRMTGDDAFARYARRWKGFESVYGRSPVYVVINGFARRLGKASQTRSLTRRTKED